MKGFQKLTLAAAIAAAPFTQAMEAMDDALLSEMTGQAGITIDVDLKMSIDAIKYVDSDGAASATQGALTMRGLTVGGDAGVNGDIAEIRGVTIDVDGTDGLVIGIGQIGGDSTGIDIAIDSIQIHNGAAQEALLAATETSGDRTSVQGLAITTQVVTAAGDTSLNADIDTYFGTTGGTFATLTTEEREDFIANGTLTETTDLDAYNLAVQTYAGAAIAVGAGDGNIGGLVIDDFRNYVEDTFVSTYNTRFDTALNNVTGNYIAAEIKINGTGNALLGTGGLSIEAQIGGLMSKAALTMGEDTDSNGVADKVHEFGVKDLAFFGTADSNFDQITDTITAMKVNVDINVVDHLGFEGAQVAALKLSNMEIEGSIVLGDIYLGTQGAANDRSLGSVLIKDIDMSGTEVFIYGH